MIFQLQQTAGATQVTNFVRGCSPEQRPIIEKLRQTVKAAMPDANEMVYHGALGYSPTESPFDRVIYILPAKSHTTLGFFFGTHLNEPVHLLTGEGARMRHVKIKSVAEAKNPEVEGLIKAASSDALNSLEALRNKRAQRRRQQQP